MALGRGYVMVRNPLALVKFGTMWMRNYCLSTFQCVKIKIRTFTYPELTK